MATNISKYVAINDFILLEYEFNKTGVDTSLNNPMVIITDASVKYFYEGRTALGNTNNILPFNSVPTDSNRINWYFDDETPETTYPYYWDSSTVISTNLYPCDTIKLHIVAGYNFDDIGGFLLQIKAEASTGDYVDLANFTYAKQTSDLSSSVMKFSMNTLYLGNKFYDKYVEFSIPSIQELGGDTASNLGQNLQIVPLSDVFITYSTIVDITDNQYTLDEKTNLQLPVTSVADNFDCFIAESTSGDYIEYYATWNGSLIGDYIADIESGRIKLYTSNNPNDNYEQFTETYGEEAVKWVVLHELLVYEHIAGGTSLLTQKSVFTQDTDFSLANFFRPIIRNADIASSYSIQYTCRLTNRMDGTQIIRKASFSSTDPKKYGLEFTRLRIENIIPYKVFNRIAAEKANVVTNNSLPKIKYVKIFYDTVKVVMNVNNEIFPQGTGPLFLRNFDSTYKFKFERIDSKGNLQNVDLSGVYNYALIFPLDEKNNKVEVSPTYSENMNTALGEIEFMLSEDQLRTIKSQTKNDFGIVVKNPNGSLKEFYSGVFYDIADEAAVMANYQKLYSVTDLQTLNSQLQAEINTLNEEITKLKIK